MNRSLPATALLLLCHAGLSAAAPDGHWIRMPTAEVDGTTVISRSPDGKGAYAFGLALPRLCTAVTLTESVHGPDAAVATAYSSGSHYGKGWRWTDCSAPPPRHQFREVVRMERSWEIHGDANNFSLSAGLADTLVLLRFAVDSQTDDTGDQSASLTIGHRGLEGSPAPTDANFINTWPENADLHWDLATTDVWKDRKGDDPATAAIEEALVDDICRTITNGGASFVYVDITLTALAKAEIANGAYMALSVGKVEVTRFDLDL